MTKSKYKQPLESFDPRMLQLLLAGARGRVNIPFLGEGGKKLAVQFQRRLQTLRARMRDADHDQATTVSRCVVRLLWGERAVAEGLINPQNVKPEDMGIGNWLTDNLGRKGAFISIQPTDLQFDHILSGLNLDATIPPQIEATPDDTVSIEDILDELPTQKES